MAIEKKRRAKMEVVMTCVCGREDRPHTTEQILLQCRKCRAMPEMANAPDQLGKYLTSIEVLLGTLKTRTGTKAALSNAVAMATRVKSPFAISIRARKIN
jgi:hypothetical protein